MSFVGPIPKKMLVCHKCDNYSCVNPDHLFLGTQQDNVDDRERKGRGAKGEKIKISKLKSDNIRTIQEMRQKGLSQLKIANFFGVSQVTIHRVLSKKTWKHI